MSSVAILFTGEYRTFDQTYSFLRDNLILPNAAKVFIYLDVSKEETTSDLESIFNFCFGSSVVSLTLDTLGSKDPIYQSHLSSILKKPHMKSLSPWIPQYLSNSGSLIEYWQFHQVYTKLQEYEFQHGMTFDLLVRCRLDILFPSPLFIQSFYDGTASEFAYSYFLRCELIDDQQLWTYLSSLDSRYECTPLPQIDDILNEVLKKKFQKCLSKLQQWKDSDSTIEFFETDIYPDLCVLIRELPLIQTFRKNVVWIGKRSCFDRLSTLIFHYGDYCDETGFHWNSESQFILHCKKSHIILLDYHSELQEEYLVSEEKNSHCITWNQEDQTWKISDKCDADLLFTILRPEGYRFDKP